MNAEFKVKRSFENDTQSPEIILRGFSICCPEV
jgi:hypothetical protein